MLAGIFSFTATYYDSICISIALFLTFVSVKGYRLVSALVALEFILHKLTHTYLFLDFRANNPWFIYLMYSSIQVLIMSMLYYKKPHFVIMGLLFINLCYNISTTLGFFYEEFISFYYAYPYFVGTIMLFELIYLTLLNKYVNEWLSADGNPDNEYIDSVFYIRSRYADRNIYRSIL